jgi:hypothetical protein
MPMTFEHEPAGVVEELGEGATGVEVGQAVIEYGCSGCGVCEMCADGSENLCLNGMISPGLGTNGAMAEFMVVDTPRHLVPIGDLDPVRAASLTDAALTPYQAIKSVLPRLVADRPLSSSARAVSGTSPCSSCVSSPRPGSSRWTSGKTTSTSPRRTARTRRSSPTPRPRSR